MYCYGYNTKHNILVMERLGKSTEYHFKKCGKKFSLRTTAMLAFQMLERLQHIHEKNLVHRDLKPENFLTGFDTQNKNRIYLIDFGLCFKYRVTSTRQHVPMRVGKSLTGTARYASVNALKGCEQSRRDDLESLGYILIYFLKGELPWQGIRGKSLQEKFEEIMKKKLELDLNSLCQDLPKEILTYLQYCRKLEFTADPDYNYLFSLFRSILRRESCDLNYNLFDWNMISETNSEEKSFISGRLKNEDQPITPKTPSTNENLNKSAVIVLNPDVSANNISIIHKNLNESEILKKTTNVSGNVKRKTTANS